MSKHIPILFSTGMVQAILEGRKTQTRRILKVKGCKPFTPDNSWSIEDIMRWNKDYHPYGQPGDVLWVRETWQQRNETAQKMGFEKFYYKSGWNGCNEAGWKSSLFMPKAACRIFLKVISVRVERLQDISELDAFSEGVEHMLTEVQSSQSILHARGLPQHQYGASLAFKDLWQTIHAGKPSSWENNPWVWVVEFERCEKPENFGV